MDHVAFFSYFRNGAQISEALFLGLDTLLRKNLRILFNKLKHFGKSAWFLGGKTGLEL